MKVRFFIAAFLLFITSAAVHAQEADSISRDELKRYAVMMDSIDVLKKNLFHEISDMVKNTDSISVTRYNELSKIADDSLALVEANATPEEIGVIKKVQAHKVDGTSEIQAAFKEMATGYVGAATYNKVRKALSSDAEVKSQYEEVMAEVKAARNEGGDEGEDAEG